MVNGDYKATISHSKTDLQDTIAGSVEADKHGMLIKGVYNNYSYILSGTYNPYIRLTQLS